LRFAGYRDRGTSSGEDCVRVAKQFCPDLILMDVQLPGMNGYSTCRALKLDHDIASIPVILMMERGEDPDNQGDIDEFEVGIIIKPSDPDQLTRKVISFLK
jgi:CheY-like chemotaxis protein